MRDQVKQRSVQPEEDLSDSSLDFAALRTEALHLLERLDGETWTDFNTHDPGITILEQLCYALSDLGYRIDYDMLDVLADGGADPLANLHSAAEVLRCQPVTTADLWRLIVDVPGVRGAWIEPLRESTLGESIRLISKPTDKTLAARFDLWLHPAGAEDVVAPVVGEQTLEVKGLYRILVDAEQGEGQVALARLAHRLHANRALCEDFAEIRLVEAQWVKVSCVVEITAVDDPGALLAAIYDALELEISPAIRFVHRGDQPETAIEDLYDGPKLEHGFLPASALKVGLRREVLHTSDLLRVLMSLPGVRTVSRLSIGDAATEPLSDWSLSIKSGRVAKLDRQASTIVLRRSGRQLTMDDAAIKKGAVAPPAAARPDADQRLQGRDRGIGQYTSIQYQFPTVYGIGELGLPESASVQRRAQAKQLSAYLMFFDQLLANQFAQLAHTKNLFSFSGDDLRTYATQPLLQPGLALHEICTFDTQHQQRLQALSEPPEQASSLERKHRFLSHLLARFAESLSDHELACSRLGLARIKQDVLRHYPACSAARGSGRNSLQPALAQRSGLEERLQRMLGLGLLSADEMRLDASESRAALRGATGEDAQQEELIAVEHILFRPGPEDAAVARAGTEPAGIPVLAAAVAADPYSQTISYALPMGRGRLQQPAFRQLVEQTLRRETPAQLAVLLTWLADDDWARLKAAYCDWLGKRAHFLALAYGREPEAAVAGTEVRAIDVRAARDRVLDLLQLGETYPLPDVLVYTPIPGGKVSKGSTGTIHIDPAQEDVLYELYVGDEPVSPATSLAGQGRLAVLVTPALKEDTTFRIRATKRAFAARRRVFLWQSVRFKIGINIDLPVSLIEPVLSYGGSARVLIQTSQPGVTYELIDDSKAVISVAPVSGDTHDLTLQTRALREDTRLWLRATRRYVTDAGTDVEEATFATPFTVGVRANPALAVSVVEGTIVEHASKPTLRIAGSQASVTYRAYVYPLPESSFYPVAPAGLDVMSIPVPGRGSVYVQRLAAQDPPQVASTLQLRATQAGNGADLLLSLGRMEDDCLVIVHAEKSHATQPAQASIVQLASGVAALVRPIAADSLPLTLTVTKNSDGVSGTLNVQGGQPGVFYHFRRTGETQELGRPAYFHRRDESDRDINKGIGLLRIELDFVVTRATSPGTADPSDLAHSYPLAPVVDLASLPTDGKLVVMAEKARTGVTWSSAAALPVIPRTPDPS